MSLDTQGAQSAGSPPAGEDQATAAANAEAGAPVDANAAESSNADDEGAKPADLLSVVKDAVKKDEPAAAASPAADGEGEAKPGEVEAKGLTPEDQAEADKKLPFHEHPRWQQVMAENRDLREDAGRFRQVDGFMQKHGLTGDEVAEGFDIMAKLKSGEPKALADVREYFATRLAFLDDALGVSLPDDLRQKVDAGEIDEDAAKETARLRAESKLREAQDEGRRQADAHKTEAERATENAQACASAVDEWEQGRRKADPDYAKKADMVEVTCRAIIQETGKPPRNPKEALALAEQAYERVSKAFKAALPTPKPVARNPIGSSAKTTAQPASLLEAVKASLDG